MKHSISSLISYGAEFSSDRIYRYRLWRIWARGPILAVVALNPSVADETVDDPTVRRCQGFARLWGYAGLEMLNLFPLRSPDPLGLVRAANPIGEFDGSGTRNENVILNVSRETVRHQGAVVAAWGNHGAYRDQSSQIVALLDYHFIPVACLGLTKAGEPKHPLYLPRDVRPMPFLGDGGRLFRAFIERASTGTD